MVRLLLFSKGGALVYLTPAAQRLLATAVEVIPKMVDAEQDAVAVAHSVELSIRWGIDAHDVLEGFLFGAFDLLNSTVDIARMPDGELAQALLIWLLLSRRRRLWRVVTPLKPIRLLL